MLNNAVYVVKMDGEREIFDAHKLRDSLARAGSSKETIDKIVEHIEGEIYDGITTSYIYKHAYEVLRRMEKPIAARYSLRRALTDLGPSGFPFEQFVAEIFRSRGYEVEVGRIIRGACVNHEVDLLAWNDKEFIVGELKFHNTQKIKSDLKVALYVKARVDDLRLSAELQDEIGDREYKGFLITNTKFTRNAITYAHCAGLNLISWGFPSHDNLQRMVERSGLHPLTCLSTLSLTKKRELMKKGIILCRSIRQNKDALLGLGLSEEKMNEVHEEAKLLCVARKPEKAK